jgi:hypothetical protein
VTAWKHRLRIADLWNDDDLPFTERRDGIVARIKRLPMYDPEGEEQDELWWLVDELGDVEDEDEFNVVWSAFYDWADVERVWVEIWERVS